MKDLSIIVTLYNLENYILECLLKELHSKSQELLCTIEGVSMLIFIQQCIPITEYKNYIQFTDKNTSISSEIVRCVFG